MTIDTVGHRSERLHAMVTGAPDDSANLPLRERKKLLTRKTIIDAAEQLFEARGYDRVTVAEIADAANVSVKTLFVYFRSKEDLAVADDWLQHQVLTSLSAERAAIHPAHVIVNVLVRAIDQATSDHDLEDYHRGYGDSPALRSRILRLWSELEDDITRTLSATDGRAASLPSDRFLAMQLVGLIRLTTSPEVRQQAGTSKARLKRIIRSHAELVEHQSPLERTNGS